MTTYYLYRDYGVNKFYEICSAIEMKYSDFHKEDLLVDIDNSLIQVYTNGNKKIVIDNCAETEKIEARSNVDLSEFEYVIAISKDGNLIYCS